MSKCNFKLLLGFCILKVLTYSSLQIMALLIASTQFLMSQADLVKWFFSFLAALLAALFSYLCEEIPDQSNLRK